jgi:multifunctional 2-oxoglutarate metabolism enzyme
MAIPCELPARSETVDPNVFETANAGFAQALYEDFLRDPATVPAEWRRLFESGRIGERPPAAAGNGASAGGNGAAAAPATDQKTQKTTPDIPDNATLIKGPAARLVVNMNESLTVPTATSFRELPVQTLERQRAALNAALKGAGRSEKVSFTHLIGWAIIQATRQHAVMGHSLAMVEGAPYRVTPEGISLGLAVDVERKDGSRGLVVPVLKRAEAMSYAEYHAAYEQVVEKARTNKLMPDDFAGATMTLTNPGGLGTVASVPRLMAGQGTIIAVGAITFPPEFAPLSKERIAELGISKVMTITSTYDHRVIQGAESGEFLRAVDQLLQGNEGFYDGVFESLDIGKPVEPRPELRSTGQADGQGHTAAFPTAAAQAMGGDLAELAHVAAAMSLVDHLRTHGHLAATLDPLGTAPVGDPSLDPAHHGLDPEVMAKIPASLLRVAVPGTTLAEALPALQATYCGNIAYEVEHIASHEERTWLREQIESGAHRQPLSADDQAWLLDRLVQVEAFERFLHKAYLGQKRFSIEGLDIMVPMLDLLIEVAADHGTREVMIGMAHRGRLNVLAHTLGRPYVTIFAEFEGSKKPGGGDVDDASTGDVKYHHGAEGAFLTRSGKSVPVTLAHNPSHLEFVGPVVDGQARARQTQRRSQDVRLDHDAAVPVIIHGDAAFAGQGVVQETLNLGSLAGYSTGGTVHLIANNQVGFTTSIAAARSTRYASDLAKGFDLPIIHVNADDAEACLAAVRLAMMYRDRFHRDALIDLVGYRRHGHNEGDEPSYTQPRMYEVIRRQPTVRQRYADELVASGALTAEQAEQRYEAAYQHLVETQQGFKASLTQAPAEVPSPKVLAWQEVETAVSGDVLAALNQQLLAVPEGFTVNPKLKKQLERRIPALEPDGSIDWGHAEALAFASLLTEGIPIRLTGQDTARGTFSHRHLVLHDTKTGERYSPMQKLPGALASFELHNSPLSELAALGFEYGYSTTAPEAMVLWEAQFGDFINGAQVIIDQFLSAGLAKWGVTCRLTLLLPHGYEGQGPEHSSARLERFLQNAAEGNMRIANCTTPAQFFHLLRRQARRQRQRPLIIFTPKSLLRLPQAASQLSDLTGGTFLPVLDDPAITDRDAVTRMVICSGKVYYDLVAEADRLERDRPAIVRIEQLYSFPEDQMTAVFRGYPNLREVVWAQEEPRNMGAWSWVAPRIARLLDGEPFRYVGRPERASPAEGYPQAHAVEQARIVGEAVGGGRS